MSKYKNKKIIWFLVSDNSNNLMKPKTKKKLEIIILLSLIWFVITLPLPWILTAPPEASQTQLIIILEITAMISVPFVILAIVWTLKPELTT